MLKLIQRLIFIAFAAGVFVHAAPIQAAEWQGYTAERFASAVAAGSPIFIDIKASWCPTCKAQRPVIDKLSLKPEYTGIAYFEVDFDSQKDVVRYFRAQRQSTLIALQGGTEVARSVANTDPVAIENLLIAAIKK